MRLAAKWIVVGWTVLMLMAIAPLARAGDTVYDRPMRPIIITKDAGGVIALYQRAWKEVEDSENIVIIDGPCGSACTLFLGIVRRDKVCYTERAVLAFHAGGKCTSDGRQCFDKPVYDEEATKELMSLYPADVRAWIASKGGLNKDLDEYLFLRGDELKQFIRRC